MARVLGPTPVAEKAASVATLWLTALGRGALCAAETTAHRVQLLCALTHSAHTDHTVNSCVFAGCSGPAQAGPCDVVDPARAEIPGSMSQGDPRGVWRSLWGVVCAVQLEGEIGR